jgi:hypothetical protein
LLFPSDKTSHKLLLLVTFVSHKSGALTSKNQAQPRSVRLRGSSRLIFGFLCEKGDVQVALLSPVSVRPLNPHNISLSPGMLIMHVARERLLDPAVALWTPNRSDNDNLVPPTPYVSRPFQPTDDGLHVQRVKLNVVQVAPQRTHVDQPTPEGMLFDDVADGLNSGIQQLGTH